MKKASIILACLAVVTIVSTACVRFNKSENSVPGNRDAISQQASTITTPSPSAGPITAAGYITDSANVIDPSTRTRLESTLTKLKERDKIDFAVVTVKTTGGKSAFDYSLELARERTSNIKDENNRSGLLLLVAVDDHNWHIQVTRNLEAQLTNEVLKGLSPVMTDSFRQQRYGEGIIKYVDAVIGKLKTARS